MPYDFKWLKEPRYYLATLTGNLTHEEIDEWMTRVFELLEKNENSLSVIMDMRSRPKFAFNVLKLQTVQRVSTHPRTGWIVIVGASALIGFWLETLRRVAGLKFKVFATIEEAEEFLDGILRVEKESTEAKTD